MSNSAEIHELLGKLQELVPNMPKNKKLSKLEIIQNVIDYIFDLQDALEAHPDQEMIMNNLPAAILSPRNRQNNTKLLINGNISPLNSSGNSPSSTTSGSFRQPLTTISSSYK